MRVKMAIPTSYLTTVKNLSGIFDAIKSAQAPEKFTTRFLASLDYKSANDRLIIGVLKSLGFLDAEGKPQEKYFRFLDQTQSAIVLAEGIRDAYSDLFQVNTKAHELTKNNIVNKFKTLSQGQYSESVIDKMGTTFINLCKLADFKSAPSKPVVHDEDKGNADALKAEEKGEGKIEKLPSATKSLGGLHYNIQIILPPSRDPKVYDALFRSLKEHLID